MNGLQALASYEIFRKLQNLNAQQKQTSEPFFGIHISCFELYGDYVFDLLNKRNKVITREGKARFSNVQLDLLLLPML